MKYIKFLTILFILIFSYTFAFAQTADDIINKYLTAVGGLDKINSIKTAKITGKSFGMGMDIPFYVTVLKPDKVLVEITMQGMTMKQAYDGTIGLQINPFMGSKDPEKMNDEQAKQMKEQAHFEGKLANYKEQGSTVELLGKEDMEGTEVYKIKLVEKDSAITNYYIDANSYLVLKEAMKRKIKEKEVNIETVMGDYKSEDGYIMPHSIETKSEDAMMGSQKITIEKVEFNVPVDDSIFTMPEGK